MSPTSVAYMFLGANKLSYSLSYIAIQHPTLQSTPAYDIDHVSSRLCSSQVFQQAYRMELTTGLVP
jgi:hypothetical protein